MQLIFQFVFVVMVEAQLTGLRRRLNCGDDIAAPTACDGCSNNNNNNNNTILSFFLFFVLLHPAGWESNPRWEQLCTQLATPKGQSERVEFVYLRVSVSVCVRKRELKRVNGICLCVCACVCKRDRESNSIAPSEQQQQATHIKPK